MFCIVTSPFLRLLLISNTNMILWRFTPVRLDGISIGVSLAIIFTFPKAVSFLFARIRILKAATVISLLGSIIFKIILPDSLWFSFGTSLINLAFGLLLTTVMLRCWSNQINRVLTSSVLRYLGLRCYNIYLFHIFFMEIAKGASENFFVSLIIECVLTFGFAYLSWRYIEFPLIKLGRKFSY